ncbi:piggyBac transposable element-derived protein 4-like [Anthonomus grandis grandis]|uniref:piggyBac transposable element-derived protein 4-like n=1 Tax=Anthonomus grandis grandis TaxID=2921223 RepID=UPI002166A90A|nr:piggyBac transposable element-derived protein 4-like [Anthonomus grandis grandis]
MSQVKKNSINSYWTNDKLLATPIFSQIMPRDRFLLLLRMSTKKPENDVLWKLRYIIDHLRDVFTKKTLYPFQDLCIDESLLLFKGRVIFKQYIPSKRHRFGIKFFLLCDCETGYVLDFIIYVGVATEIKKNEYLDKDIGISGNIVLTFLERYLSKGHSLYVDNWYTSPTLFTYLHKNKTNACGTVRKNRRNLPNLSKNLKSGEIEYMSTDRLLALKWKDKREVRMLSTFHNSDMKDSGKVNRTTKEEIRKPVCVLNYIENMGAVDRSDMLLSSVECVRKTVKWYKKLFFHLLDLSLLNSHAVYKMVTGKNISLLDFQGQLIKQILEAHHLPQQHSRSGRRSADGDNPSRQTERHFVSMIPATAAKKFAQRKCIVCSKYGKRSDTRYMCALCDVPLCLLIYFERYHSCKYY